MPVRGRPKRMMTTPAICANRDLQRASNWPTSVEIAPRVMKTTLNPSMKPTEFSMTLRSSCASCDLSSSTPAPEISETYPGTSGSTQGERNDTNPATKAAIGSGRLDIQKYCTCVLQWFANQCRPEGSLSLVTDSGTQTSDNREDAQYP